MRPVSLPMADGGEGLLEVFGGANRVTSVSGPLGDDVDAGWRFDGRTAIIEMARASGLHLVGGADDNDAVAASTFGTGELITAALEAGVATIEIARPEKKNAITMAMYSAMAEALAKNTSVIITTAVVCRSRLMRAITSSTSLPVV